MVTTSKRIWTWGQVHWLTLYRCSSQNRVLPLCLRFPFSCSFKWPEILYKLEPKLIQDSPYLTHHSFLPSCTMSSWHSPVSLLYHTLFSSSALNCPAVSKGLPWEFSDASPLSLLGIAWEICSRPCSVLVLSCAQASYVPGRVFPSLALFLLAIPGPRVLCTRLSEYSKT